MLPCNDGRFFLFFLQSLKCHRIFRMKKTFERVYGRILCRYTCKITDSEKMSKTNFGIVSQEENLKMARSLDLTP